MPDLNAGTKVKGLDTPPTVDNQQPDSFSFNITAFGIAITSGIYNDCGVAFVAPTTGRVLIHYAADLNNSSTTDYTAICPVVRLGSTIGSGGTVEAASFANSMYDHGTAASRDGTTILVEGLTPGADYNVRLEHRIGVGTNTGTIQHRTVIVEPTT